MNIITLESCHSTWIFDSRQLRFCRILRGIAVGRTPDLHRVAPLLGARDRPHGKSFTVFLNEARTRLVRSSIHTEACAQCGGSPTDELSLEEIHSAVA